MGGTDDAGRHGEAARVELSEQLKIATAERRLVDETIARQMALQASCARAGALVARATESEERCARLRSRVRGRRPTCGDRRLSRSSRSSAAR